MAKNKVENQLVTLSKQDFDNAGINVSLNTNDMVEVIANDIFEKYVEHVHGIKQEYSALLKEYKELFFDETKELVSTLKGLGYWVDETSNTGITYSESWSFAGSSSQWNSKGVDYLKITEELNRGMIVKLDQNKSFFRLPIAGKIKVKIAVSAEKETKTDNISTNGITGSMTTMYTRDFQKEINISTARFKEFGKKLDEYQQKINQLFKFLPANGVLSIERFTREARVKMNKKLLASQGPEFKVKLEELYGIKL